MRTRWKIALLIPFAAVLPMLMGPTGGIPAFLRVSSIGVNTAPGAAGVANIAGPINLFPAGGGSATLNVSTSGSGATGSVLVGNATGASTGQIFATAGTGDAIFRVATNGSLRGIFGASGSGASLLGDASTGDLVIRGDNGSARLSINGGTSTEALFNSSGLTLAHGLTTGTTANSFGANTTVTGVMNATSDVRVNGVSVCRSNGTNCPTAPKYVAGTYNGNNGGNCTVVASTYNTGITSCTRSSTGLYTFNVTAAGFTTIPVCTTSYNSAVLPSGVIQINGTPTTTQVQVNSTNNATAQTDTTGFSLVCVGS
jgi:hypothetical protein